MTTVRYARVTATQQRDAADLLDRARTGRIQSVSHAGVTGSEDAVAQSGPEGTEEGNPRGESGSGGRIRTYDLAVNSRPLYR